MEAGSQGGASTDESSALPAGAAEPSSSTGSTSSAPTEAAVQGEVRTNGASGWCTIPDCGALCSSWEEYEEHLGTRHAVGKRKFRCHLCLEPEKLGKKTRHLEAHHLSDLPCPRCPARFLKNNLLQIHLSSYHRHHAGGQRPVWCLKHDCPLQFALWDEFVQHYLKEHRTLNPSKLCKLCFAPDTDGRHARDHVLKTQFHCRFCSARFTDRSALSPHTFLFHKQ